MTLPRFLLVLVMIWAGGPSASVWLLETLWPDRVGRFTEQAQPVPQPTRRVGPDYRPPESIGARHEVTVKSFAGIGDDVTRSWHGYSPGRATRRPAIVLLHGSGRDGLSMLDVWQDHARRQGLILIAPNAAGRRWSMLQDGPVFLKSVLEDAQARYRIDPDQIYLVGHSAGAIHAMHLANLGWGPWRAVALHAGHAKGWRSIAAPSPIPVRAFLGNKDQLFEMEDARAALQVLARAGHDVQLTVLKGHFHWYYDVGPALSPIIWRTLQQS